MTPEPQPAADAKVPVFRISLTNATVLCAGYLVVGALVEGVRRAFNPRWAEQLSWSLEAFPAGILRTVGLLQPLREAYAHGAVRETTVRLAYAAAVAITVYAIGLGVGALMWLAMRLRRG